MININKAYSNARIKFLKDKNQFILQNPYFSRTLQVDPENNAFYTVGFKNLITGSEFSVEGSDEFAYKI